MKRVRLATVWLSGCSGCHMSLLNLHGSLFELFAHLDLVYSPLMDIKEYPRDVDIALIEGAVANSDNREFAEIVRNNTGMVVSLGDCAVNGNVPGLRNSHDVADVLRCSYGEDMMPLERSAELLTRVLPLHQVIRVDRFIPGCPPAPALIMEELGRILKPGQADQM